MAVNMLRGACGASKELLDDKDYFDVTIARDDDLTPPSNEQFEAHRVIDSACGPFLKSILKSYTKSDGFLLRTGCCCGHLSAQPAFPAPQPHSSLPVQTIQPSAHHPPSQASQQPPADQTRPSQEKRNETPKISRYHTNEQ